MPLPHFLMLVAAVVAAAGLSLLLALAVGVPLPVLALGAMAAALVAHMAARTGAGDGIDGPYDGGPHGNAG